MHKLQGVNGMRAIAASLVLIGDLYEIAGTYSVAEAHQNNLNKNRWLMVNGYENIVA